MSTALVVDDGKVDQRLAGRLLREKLGLSIVYADNGREALASIERQLPDVVVTDIMMPACGDSIRSGQSRARRDLEEPYYYARDPHWTPKGHRLVGEHLEALVQAALAAPLRAHLLTTVINQAQRP